MAKTYFNFRGQQGRETVDELDPADFPDRKAVAFHRDRLQSEYALAGMAVYTSSRACAGWND